MTQEIEQEAQKLHNRLIRLQGQLSGIDRMIAEGRDCADVLQQFAAARAAMQKAIAAYQQKVVNDCLIAGEENLSARKKLAGAMIDMINRI